MKEEIISFYKFYDAKLPVNILMTGISYCDSTYYISRTDSELYSIEYITKGSQTLNINGKTITAKANDICILTKHSNHNYYACKGGLVKYWIAFDGEIIKHLFSTYIGQNIYIVNNCNIGIFLSQAFETAKREKNQYQFIVDQLSEIIYKILIEMHHTLVDEDKSLSEKFKNWIDMKADNKLKLQDAVKYFHYSENYMINIFKENYGETPYEYYLKKKMETARHYLINTNLPIGDIAYKLGYTDTQYFCTCFKKYYDVAPATFRKSFIRK